MTDQNLHATVRSISPFVKVIDIDGELNSFSEPALTKAYAQAISDNTRTILFNFSKMTYLNSVGIGMLVVFLVRAQREHKNLGGYGLSEHYRNIFDVTRLDHVIPIYSSEEVARTSIEPYDLPEREN